MDSETNTNQTAGSTAPQASVPVTSGINTTPHGSGRKKLLIVVVAVLVVLFGLSLVLGKLLTPKTADTKSSAAKLFYATLSKTAQQTTVHLAHYSTEYQNQAAKDKHDPGNTTIDNSVAEFDLKSKTYSSLYVGGDGVIPLQGRCIKNVEYVQDVDKGIDLTSIAQAEQDLKNPSHPASDAEKFDSKDGPCSYNSPFRHGKLTDGIIPMGFSPTQTKNWLDSIQLNNMFALKDEGSASYNGQSGRKISFTLNHTTDFLFYAQRDGTSNKVGANNTDSTLFDRLLDPGAGTNMSGYYIIDEKTDLPIYSEFHDEAVPGQESQFIPYDSKQHYSYPTTLSMDKNTQLEFSTPS
ncbi:MAG TPA: hypothetical protein VLG11_01625 [Candidatus Saccharimonadales bacterium]|nr:hypothetical protein [Candidatus Saccharimonadales bacterium]